MKYYIVYIPGEFGLFLEPRLDDHRLKSFENALKNGVPIAEEDIPEHHITGRRKPPLQDAIRGDGRIPYVNERAKSILQGYICENIQFVKVGAIASNNYYALNLIGSISCMDLDESDYRKLDNGQIIVRNRIVLLESEIPKNTLLFRMKEYPDFLIASHDFTDLIKKHKISGWGFRKMDFILGSHKDAVPGLPILRK